MSSDPSICVVGGGVAGLTLGIELRRQGVQVELLEAGSYPRHRVCGEFISGAGTGILRQLGIYQQMLDAGGIEAETMRLYGQRHRSPVLPMPEAALCISRYRMDRIMADAYLSLGGVLRQGSRVTGKDALAREGMVMATGKRMGPHQNATHLGFKVHAQGLELAADLELHFAPGAYVGLCRIENGLVNVCGLVSERLAPRDLRYTWRSFIGSLLHPSCREAFDAAIMDTTSLCFSAGLHYGLKPVLNDQSLYIGDRSLSIPPLSGNGMSIGMETSMMASRQLIAFARGTRPWKDALGRIQKDYYRRFRSRLVWAGGLQSLMLPMRHNLLREWTVACAKWHYRFLYRVTR